MRRLILSAALAVVFSLASCSNDKELGNTQTKNGDREINFRGLIDKGAASRATITESGNLLSFTVTGWWDKTSDGTGQIDNPDQGEYLFNAFDITRGDVNAPEQWNYNPKLYWPSKGSGITFFAYSPASSNNVHEGLYDYKKDTSSDMIAYTVPDPGVAESQEDFLLAKTNPLNKETVKLSFVHALSRATFSARKLNAGITYEIKSVELIRINKGAEIDLNEIPYDGVLSSKYNDNPGNSDEPVILWTNHINEGDIKIDMGETPVSVRADGYFSILGPTNALMIMPQKTTDLGDPDAGTGFLIRVLYKAYIIKEDPGTYYAGTKGDEDNTWAEKFFAPQDPVRSTSGNPVPFAFEIGRQYNFALTFGSEAGGEIGFDVTTSEWTDAPRIELPQETAFWNIAEPNKSLISATLAAKANLNYATKGVSLADIIGVSEISLSNIETDDLKGLRYFTNLTKITIDGTKFPTELDLAGLYKLNDIDLMSTPVFSKIDLSGITNKMQINIVNKVSGASAHNEVTVDNLILWSGYQTGDNSTYLVKINQYAGDYNGYITISAINGDYSKGIAKTKERQYWK